MINNYAIKLKSNANLLIYLAALFLLSFARIDDSNPLMYVVNALSSLIPSISATANVSPNPNCAKLILLICWLSVIPFYFVTMKNIRTMTQQSWNDISASVCKCVGTKNILTVYLITVLGTLLILYSLYFYNPLGGYSWRRVCLYNLVHSSNMFMTLWGVCITLGTWAMLVFTSLMTYGIATKK
jgi:hypothetical protein